MLAVKPHNQHPPLAPVKCHKGSKNLHNWPEFSSTLFDFGNCFQCRFTHKLKKNKLANLEATLVRNYDRLTH